MGVLSRFLTGVPTVKRRLGRPGRGMEDNIRADLKEIGMNTRNWVDFSFWFAYIIKL